MESNNYIPRAVETYAFDEILIARHMVFIAGPRQTGKTFLARKWLEKKKSSGLYYNWDDITTRQAYRKDSRFFESPARSIGITDPWIVFDEIHKRNHWHDILKGTYDLFGNEFRFLITGSARLDLFRTSGDSLVGRYNLFHMMPLSINEIVKQTGKSCFLQEKSFEKMANNFEEFVSTPLKNEIVEAYQTLKHYGPFPEPFLAQNDRFGRKWHQDYISLLISQDLRDLTRVVELDKIENLVFILAPRIMSPVSMPNLAGDLEAAHSSVKNWLEQLKRLYLIFPVPAWSKKIPRGLKKAKKWYFIDWYYAPDGPACLENMVATCLNKTCLALSDMGFGNYRLHYIKTLDKKEIDFVITKDNIPVLAVEVKTKDNALSRTLKDRVRWFKNNDTIGVQIVDQRNILKKYPDNTWIMSIEKFLSILF